MKRFLIALFVLLLVPSIAFGDEIEDYNEYLNQYDLSFFDDLSNDVNDVLKELNIDDFDFRNVTNLSISKIFEIIIKIVNQRLKYPLKSTIKVFIFIFLSAMFQSFNVNDDDGLKSTYSVISSLVIVSILLIEISKTITLCSNSLSICANFIFAFVPVFCAIIAVGGGVTTSFSTNTLLLVLAQGLNFISSNIFMPIINSFLAIGVCSGIREELNLSGLLSSLKRMITTIISFVSAGFVSIVSIKTAVSSKSDILGIRSVRFLINSVVPIIGGTISEGLLSIQSYSSLIKSSVGVVGIIAIAFVFLPSIIEVLCWRFMLSVCSIISDAFCDKTVSLVINAFKNTLLLINVILILSMMTTVISIGILIAARTA